MATCYKDMWFCKFYADCSEAGECHRPLTEKVRRDAHKFGLPVCVYSEKPSCFKEKDTEIV